jgi:hypothetical protein
MILKKMAPEFFLGHKYSDQWFVRVRSVAPPFVTMKLKLMLEPLVSSLE